MAKKNKKRRNELFRREKGRMAARRTNLIFMMLALTVVIAVLIGRSGAYELGQPSSTGFVHWFLLFTGYIPLLIWSSINLLLGLDFRLAVGREIWTLGICDLVTVGIAWGVVRLLGRRFGTELLNIAGNFALMLLVWGWFQIGCTVVLSSWEHGGLVTLHRHLHREAEPEKVIVVPSKSESGPAELPKNP